MAMPRKANAEIVGRNDCQDCGQRCAVYQNTRGDLYTKCAECGVDQRNGKTVQNRLWYTTDWVAGEPEVRPAKVDPEPPANLGASKPAKKPEPAPDPAPAATDDQDTDAAGTDTGTPDPKKKSSGLGFLVVLGTIAAAALGLSQ